MMIQTAAGNLKSHSGAAWWHWCFVQCEVKSLCCCDLVQSQCIKGLCCGWSVYVYGVWADVHSHNRCMETFKCKAVILLPFHSRCFICKLKMHIKTSCFIISQSLSRTLNNVHGDNKMHREILGNNEVIQPHELIGRLFYRPLLFLVDAWIHWSHC